MLKHHLRVLYLTGTPPRRFNPRECYTLYFQKLKSWAYILSLIVYLSYLSQTSTSQSLSIATVSIIHRQLNGTNTVNRRRKELKTAVRIRTCVTVLIAAIRAVPRGAINVVNLGSHVRYAAHKHQHSVSNTWNEFTLTG